MQPGIHITKPHRIIGFVDVPHPLMRLGRATAIPSQTGIILRDIELHWNVEADVGQILVGVCRQGNGVSNRPVAFGFGIHRE